MRLRVTARSQRTAAFSFVEIMVAVGIFGITFVSLYGSISAGFALIRVNRENLRATQIMEEKMETVRLYRWDQVTNVGFIPTNFTDVFYKITNAVNTNLASGAGITYTGKVTISTISMTESYSNDLRKVSVNVQWMSGKNLRSRDMSTFVSRYGVQNYVYY